MAFRSPCPQLLPPAPGRKELHPSVLSLPCVCTPLKHLHGHRRRKRQLLYDFHPFPLQAISFLLSHIPWRGSGRETTGEKLAVHRSPLAKVSAKGAMVGGANTVPTGSTEVKSDCSGIGWKVEQEMKDKELFKNLVLWRSQGVTRRLTHFADVATAV